MTPPSVEQLLLELRRERYSRAMGQYKPTVGGKYLHWDSLRHRKPPADLTLEEWWLGIKLARTAGREQLPLLGTGGEAFSLVYAPPLRQRLHEIDQSFGVPRPKSGATSDVQGMVDAHGPKYLLTNSLMEEAIRSSQLEGASTTREKAKDLLRDRREPKDKSERMIVNNFLAMERIAELASAPLTAEAVLELHSILVDGTLDDPGKAGVFRDDRDRIVVELLHSTETAHVPPRAAELVARMDRLLEFANGQTPEEWLHPVLRSIALHFMIGFDHPFVDGNGRVARALFYWSMLRHGYPLTKYLSISKVLREAPAQYARAYLLTETDDGDLTYFILHQLEVIQRSIAALAQYVERKASDTRAVEARLRDSQVLNHRQLRLLGHALRHPGFQYTVQSHQTSHRVVNNTARSDLDELARQGLLIKTKQGRRHVFVAPHDLEERAAGLKRR